MRTAFVIPCFFLVFAGVAGQVKIPEMIQLEYNINKSDKGVNIYETRLGSNKVFALGSFRMGIGLDLHKFDLDYTYTGVEENGMSFTATYILRPQASLSYLLGEEWSFTAFVRPEAASDFHGDWTGLISAMGHTLRKTGIIPVVRCPLWSWGWSILLRSENPGLFRC